MKLTAAIIITKLAIIGLRLIKKGGTTLPGKIALKISPDILSELSNKFRIIMVTGTNGKTTTCRIASGMLDKSGIKYITNKSGANLASGITTTLIDALTLTGRAMVRTALLETDEAAFRTVAPKLKPEIVIVTNFFKDQLDRFGELYNTLNYVREGILSSPETTLILNADDSLCASLGQGVDNPVLYFGFADEVYPESNFNSNNDAPYCINCSTRYLYSSATFAHLGHYRCPSCNYERPKAQIECTQVLHYDNLTSTVEINTPAGKFAAKLALPGLYNIYNALAATCLGHYLNLEEESIVQVLQGFESGFGRMETVNVMDREIKMILVKNPTGFNQVLKYMMTQRNKCVVALALNDKLADGTDISWIWDVDFEILSFMQDKIRSLCVSGVRAEDMAVRLKYAGVDETLINIKHDEKQLVNHLINEAKENEAIYILPTYSAMLDIRQVLKNRFNLKDFWK
ncbi:MAG: Mur ligase family protein [Clostridiaceae bacterium]|nr:Mur ligase family protein [Clostridiaceae bacterium]